MKGQMPDIHIIHQDGAAVYIVKPFNEIDKGCFSRTGRSHDRNGLAGICHKRDIIKHDLLAESKGDVAKFHLSAHFPGQIDRVRRIDNAGLRIIHFDDLIRGRKKALQVI